MITHLWCAWQKYAADIAKAKLDHWNDFLENMMSSDIWMANRCLSSPTSNGGRTRIHMLKVKGRDGQVTEVNTNEGKAKTLAEAFFPPKPAMSTVPRDYEYPSPLLSPLPVTEAQIHAHIVKLSPLKAPGPDWIPNIVLQKMLNHIVPYFLSTGQSYIMQYTIADCNHPQHASYRRAESQAMRYQKHTDPLPYYALWPKFSHP
jgi:hypothetical protein